MFRIIAKILYIVLMLWYMVVVALVISLALFFFILAPIMITFDVSINGVFVYVCVYLGCTIYHFKKYPIYI